VSTAPVRLDGKLLLLLGSGGFLTAVLIYRMFFH
jgi:hypothetical protein